jgi:LacI family transcriptional regulator
MPKQCFGAEAGYQCAQSLLQSGERVTAAVCMNDLIALGALRACADRGVKVPADLSVIGFDDICLGSNAAETNRLGGYTKPRLTTVRLPHPQIGRDVARRLVALVREGAEERHENVDITPTLVTRESTVPVHAGGGA